MQLLLVFGRSSRLRRAWVVLISPGDRDSSRVERRVVAM
jgi:hypothetical protein